MTVTKGYIEQLKNETSLIELVQEYTRLEPELSGMRGRCPHPDHNDTSPSFFVHFNLERPPTFYCYGCNNIGASGKRYGTDCFSFIQWMSDSKDSKFVYSFLDAVEVLANRPHVPIQTPKKTIEVSNNKDRTKEALMYHWLLNDNALEYFQKRGLTDKTIETFKLGSNENAEVTIPLPVQDKFVSITTHIPGAKYRTSPGFKKHLYLYGANIEKDKPLYLVEGYFDAMLLNQNNIQALALMGTSLSDEQYKLVQDKNPILFLDDDPPGIKATQQIIKRYPLKYIQLSNSGMDPADLINSGVNIEKLLSSHLRG